MEALGPFSKLQPAPYTEIYFFLVNAHILSIRYCLKSHLLVSMFVPLSLTFPFYLNPPVSYQHKNLIA